MSLIANDRRIEDKYEWLLQRGMSWGDVQRDYFGEFVEMRDGKEYLPRSLNNDYEAE